MSWTPWRKLADKVEWYEEHSLRFPVCYELAISDPHDPDAFRVVFAGAAANEWDELKRYERGEPEVWAKVRAELDQGRELFYRAVAFPTLDAAEAKLAMHVASGAPPWNG